ncbi:MAG TPA: nuclease-related domain-containing protein, partial [Acidimicrobiales bacterium]|nr:nuclease-related domain-containing protein [Acidimicrobiales bacterium]
MLIDQRRSDHRAGIGARRVAADRTWVAMRRPRVWLGGMAAMAAAVGVVLGTASVQEAVTGRPMASWFVPFVLGAALASFPCLAWIAITSVDGSATWRIGADAEGWTADVLRDLGPDWRIEHTVPFPDRRHVVDVDHIAVGPYGVLVVETKWTGQAVDLSRKRLAPHVVEAMEQVEGNAGRVQGLLRRVNTGVPIIPVVVYWGPNVVPPAGAVRREGNVRVVAGRRGGDWGSLLSRDRIDARTIDSVAERVRSWRVEQEQKTLGVAVAARLRR